jgi:ParB-like chromosome segregation protein Spo0J
MSVEFDALAGPMPHQLRAGLIELRSGLPVSEPTSGATTQKKRKKRKKTIRYEIEAQIEMRPLGWFLYRDQSSGNQRMIMIGIKELIQASGFAVPVLARGNGEVIVGDLSVKAAHSLGLAEAPVILCDGWTLGRIRVFRQLAKEVPCTEWSLQTLASRLEEIEDGDLRVDIAAWTPAEIEAALAREQVPVSAALPSSPALLRLEFLNVAQEMIPELGLFLRPYLHAEPEVLKAVIRAWQVRFHLPDSWTADFAYSTVRMWERDPEAAEKLQWFVGAPAHDGREVGLFRYETEREWHEGYDFAEFKRSLHTALEESLERFGESRRAQDTGKIRRPQDLPRALRCLVMRVCLELTPGQIAKQPSFSREWTSLFRDMKAAAQLIGLTIPGPGRPKERGHSKDEVAP